jgi:hypothetical protein
MGPERFFIWNSLLEHPQSSLDHYSDIVRASLVDYEGYLLNLLHKSPRIGSSLFIKTYAHSLEGAFLKNWSGDFPLCHPNVLAMFGKLESFCEKNNVSLNYSTAREVHDVMRNIDAGGSP